MTITELVTLTQRVHDAEQWNLGAASTRESRNAFIERVIGIAHWGHPTFNPTPDPRWNCKDPDGQGGRPMSDDVVVRMPEREAFDLVLSAGTDGYRIAASEPFFLPTDQWVFAPSRPVLPPAPAPPPPPAPAPAPAPGPAPVCVCDLTPLVARLDALAQAVEQLRPVAPEDPVYPVYEGKAWGVVLRLRPVVPAKEGR